MEVQLRSQQPPVNGNAGNTDTRRRYRRPAKSGKPEDSTGAVVGNSGNPSGSGGGEDGDNTQEGQQQQKPRRTRPPRQSRRNRNASKSVPEPNAHAPLNTEPDAQIPPNAQPHPEGELPPPSRRRRTRNRKPPATAATEDGAMNEYQQQRTFSHAAPANNNGASGGGNARRRAFGAQLSATTPDVETPPQNPQPRVRIRPDAPAFMPGADDITSRIHREIGNGSYECMVCYGSVGRKAKIWSCKCCWAVYHLNCIQKWGKQGLEQESRGPVGASEPQKSWRCPACNNPSTELPSLYTCWCEKETQPEGTRYLPPHRYANLQLSGR